MTDWMCAVCPAPWPCFVHGEGPKRRPSRRSLEDLAEPEPEEPVSDPEPEPATTPEPEQAESGLPAHAPWDRWGSHPGYREP